MRVAVSGKGGVGKSLIAATMARLVAREGTPVLVMDCDVLPGLSLSLGSGPDPAVPPLTDAVHRDEQGRWGWRPGIDASIAAQRFSTAAPDGVRLLQRGKADRTGLSPTTAASKALWEVGQGLVGAEHFRDWALIGDLPGGLRETADDWAPYADTHLVVVLPTAQSVLAARRLARLARTRKPRVRFVANHVRSEEDVRHVEQLLGEPVLAAIPSDEAVRIAERMGIATIDHAPASPSVAAIERLIAALRGQPVRAS
ncbi:MAG TPA: P-loop NTPase [Solirubrobacteraceae bacterium]|nr:P-loop NTPase [Solirubrobacteraceae bacterium]